MLFLANVAGFSSKDFLLLTKVKKDAGFMCIFKKLAV